MRAKKIKSASKKKTKTVRRKSTKVATTAMVPAAAAALDEALPSVVALVPEQRYRHAIYNGLVLAAAIVTLAFVAGSVALSKFGSTDAPVNRFDEAAVQREIDRAVAEGRFADESLPLVMPIIPAVKAEAKPDTKADIQTHAKPEATGVKKAAENGARPPRSKAQRPRERHTARPQSSNGLDAMASLPVGNELIAEARKYLGGNPTGRASEWCGAFLDLVLRRTGRRGGGNLARGYLNYGTRLAGPEVGAIVVLSRTGGGHVGIVTGVDSNGNPIVISGNHNRRVAISSYPAKRVIAYVRPDSRRATPDPVN